MEWKGGGLEYVRIFKSDICKTVKLMMVKSCHGSTPECFL